MTPSGKLESDPGAMGRHIRSKRELRRESLSSVSGAAGISAAYLQKLEAGGVRGPSPKVLHELSRVLGLDYTELMRLAGYFVPSQTPKAQTRRSELTYSLSSEDYALSSEELTTDEAEELRRYLSWYRHTQSAHR